MEEKVLDKKWSDYFYNMRNKYDMRLSANKPIIMFLNAKYLSKNKIDLLDEKEKGFFDAMGLAAKYFTTKYNCIAICGNDQISFIIENTDNFIQSINNEKKYRANDVAAIFSQYFFEYFNNVYDGEKIYWNCKGFNISKEKIKSFLRFKSNEIQEKVTSIFLKKDGVKNAYDINLEEKIKMCKKYEQYFSFEKHCFGRLYYNGKRIDLNEYLKGQFVVLKDKKDAEEFFDLINFDNLL